MKRIRTETFVMGAFTTIGMILIAVSLIDYVEQTHTVVGNVACFLMGMVFMVVGAVVGFSDEM